MKKLPSCSRKMSSTHETKKKGRFISEAALFRGDLTVCQGGKRFDSGYCLVVEVAAAAPEPSFAGSRLA